MKIWEAAADQETRTFASGGNYPGSVAFGAESRRLTVASGSPLAPILKVWDAATGQELHSLSLRRPFSKDTRTLMLMVQANNVVPRAPPQVDGRAFFPPAALSPDGRLAALANFAGTQTVTIRDMADGKEVGCLAGHQQGTAYLVFSPDSRRLATADGEGTVRVWEATSGREVLSLKGHAGAGRSLAFSPNGQRLASPTGRDMTVRVWDAQTGQEVITLRAHTDSVALVAFSPDGRWLASASSPELMIWDAVTWRQVCTIHLDGDGLQGLAFSPDGRRLAAAAGWTLRLYEVPSGEEILSLAGHYRDLAFSRDGRRLAAAELSGIVKVWDATIGYELEREVLP